MINSKDTDTKKIATSAIICALSLVFLITGVIPLLFYVSIFIAICIPIVILNEYGAKYWVMCYIVTSILAVILSPDLELTLTYICMGWYPIVKKHMDKNRKQLRRLGKTIVYIVASLIIYNISIRVFGGLEVDIPFFIIAYIAVFVFDFFLLDTVIDMTQNRIIPLIRNKTIRR